MYPRPLLLIAGDTLTAQCLQRLLDSEFPSVEIVANGHDFPDVAATLRPDLVLLDISIPGLDGFVAARRLAEVSPTTKLIVVTMHDQPEYAAEALRVGASGYVLKWCAVSELVTAIRRVLNGHSYMAPSLVERMAFATNHPQRQKSKNLTRRQREVLQLVAQGRTAKEIANTLGLSVKTAVFHKMAIMDKLGLRTTADLTRYALEYGILSSQRNAGQSPPSAALPLASNSSTA